MILEDLPNDWLVTEFTEILDIQGGTQPPKSKFIYEPKDGYIRLLQIRDFGENPVPTYIPANGNLKKCDHADVLIARYGASIGRICTGMDGAYNVALAKVLKPKELFSGFLRYYLDSALFQDPLRLISRSAQNGFNKEDLAKFIIVLPSFAEQKQIAAKLDELLAQVDAIKSRIDAIPGILKRFRQSVLAAAVSGQITEAFSDPKTWTFCSLGDVIETGPQNGIYKPAKEYGTGTKILRIGNFYEGKVADRANLKRLNLSVSERERWRLNEGDIVINRVNSLEYLGKSALIKQLTEPTVFESNIMRFSLKKDKASPEFVIKFLNSEEGLTKLRANAKHAVNQASINQEDVKKCKLALPPLDVQDQIALISDKLFTFADNIENRVKDAQNRVNQLTQSILAKAFRGDLTAEWREHNPHLITGENSAEALLNRIKAERAAKAPKKKNRQRRAKPKTEKV